MRRRRPRREYYVTIGVGKRSWASDAESRHCKYSYDMPDKADGSSPGISTDWMHSTGHHNKFDPMKYAVHAQVDFMLKKWKST